MDGYTNSSSMKTIRYFTTYMISSTASHNFSFHWIEGADPPSISMIAFYLRAYGYGTANSPYPAMGWVGGGRICYGIYGTLVNSRDVLVALGDGEYTVQLPDSATMRRVYQGSVG